MATLLAILFFVLAIIVMFVVLFGMLDAHVMPLACPKCFKGADRDLAGEPEPWYRAERGGRYECRTCYARFREHANGTLVEDR